MPLPVLIGETPVNLLLRSEELEDAAWNVTTVTLTPDTVETLAPNETQTAEKLAPTGTNSFLRQTGIAVVPNRIYTWSIWLKSTGADRSIRIGIHDNGLSLIQGNSITVTPDWQRFEVSADVGANSLIQVLIGGGSTWSTGEDVYGWGGQLNPGGKADSYVKTIDTQVQ